MVQIDESMPPRVRGGHSNFSYDESDVTKESVVHQRRKDDDLSVMVLAQNHADE